MRADVGAGPALSAFGANRRSRVFRNGSHGAVLLTLETVIAVLTDLPFEKAQRRDQAEQCPQGTEIAAPEPRHEAVEGDDASKDDEADRCHIKNRLDDMEV